ncbi:hypothetical protein [Aquiflexum sp.]
MRKYFIALWIIPFIVACSAENTKNTDLLIDQSKPVMGWNSWDSFGFN